MCSGTQNTLLQISVPVRQLCVWFTHAVDLRQGAPQCVRKYSCRHSMVGPYLYLPVFTLPKPLTLKKFAFLFFFVPFICCFTNFCFMYSRLNTYPDKSRRRGTALKHRERRKAEAKRGREKETGTENKSHSVSLVVSFVFHFSGPSTSSFVARLPTFFSDESHHKLLSNSNIKIKFLA